MAKSGCNAFVPGARVLKIDSIIWVYGTGVQFALFLTDFCRLVEAFLFDGDSKIEVQQVPQDDTPPIQVISGSMIYWRSQRSIQHVLFDIGDYEELVGYVFYNEDVRKDDPRLSLLNRIVIGNEDPRPEARRLYDWLAGLEKKPGWNSYYSDASDAKRLTPM
jgi:hypothetical protein